MVERNEILRQWRAARARLQGGAATSSTPTNALSGHRQCAEKVLRYLIARYQDDKRWGPFRGPSGGRAPRAFRRPSTAVEAEVSAPLIEIPPDHVVGHDDRLVGLAGGGVT